MMRGSNGCKANVIHSSLIFLPISCEYNNTTFRRETNEVEQYVAALSLVLFQECAMLGLHASGALS